MTATSLPRGLIAGLVVLTVSYAGAASTAGISLRSQLPQKVASPTPDAPASASPAISGTPTARVLQTTGPVPVTPDLKRGVVLIEATLPREVSAGTGMMISADGLVLTNYHVVRSSEKVRVTVAATEKRYTAEVVGHDPTRDIAVLKLRRTSEQEIVTFDTDPLNVGDAVVAAGNAHGQGYVTANRGNVKALGQRISVTAAHEGDPSITLTGLIEATTPGWPGDSGGPLFDLEGEVTGMTTAGGEKGSTALFAIPIADALAVATKIERGDESGTVIVGRRPFLGVTLRATNEGGEGVRIDAVEAKSPAAKAGVQRGDRLVTVGEARITTRAQLFDVLNGFEPGDSVQIGWRTNGRVRTATVELAEHPLN